MLSTGVRDFSIHGAKKAANTHVSDADGGYKASSVRLELHG
jgi:hypothetical protein